MPLAAAFRPDHGGVADIRNRSSHGSGPRARSRSSRSPRSPIPASPPPCRWPKAASRAACWPRRSSNTRPAANSASGKPLIAEIAEFGYVRSLAKLAEVEPARAEEAIAGLTTSWGSTRKPSHGVGPGVVGQASHGPGRHEQGRSALTELGHHRMGRRTRRRCSRPASCR